MSIEVMKQALSALEAEISTEWECNSYHPSIYPAMQALRTAIQQAEAKTDEPVFFVSPAQARAVNGKNRCHYTPPDNSGRYLPVRATPAGLFTQPVYTHPAQGVPEKRTVDPSGVVESADEGYIAGWNACREAMLAASPAQKGQP